MRNASTRLLGFLRNLSESGTVSELPDRELVQRFADDRDEAAFAALVRRHGAMVLAVCHRLLCHDQDAEDVFQAVFLVLSRKAGTLRNKEAVSPWLYGVARRLALRARQAGRKRRDREAGLSQRRCENPLLELTVREAQMVLDEELANLPERERAPLVLCYLQGLTRDEAAQRLGCPLGTLKARLERARATLQQRLTRRGLALQAALATFLLTSTSASAVPAALLTRAIQAGIAYAQGPATVAAVGPAARALANEWLQSSRAGAVKIAAACLMLTAVFLGLGRSTAPDPQPPVERATESALAPPRAAERFLDLQRHANHKLADDYGREGNNLAALPRGEQTLAGVRFNIGEGLIVLSGKSTAHDRPACVEGIEVGGTFRKLHILHATHWSAPQGALVGHYTVRYEDRSAAVIPLAYGKDVSDWWQIAGALPPSHAAVAWEGRMTVKDACTDKIRLYMTTWHNPHPARRVSSMDFTSSSASSKDGPEAAPFCVAVTIE